MSRSPYRYTRHAGDYAVTRPVAHVGTIRLGTVRREGQTWTAYPSSAEQAAHVYVPGPHWTRENAAAVLDRAYRDALAATV